jgi:hypothetical protein
LGGYLKLVATMPSSSRASEESKEI